MFMRPWCQENRFHISFCYKWQLKAYTAAKPQKESCFLEVVPVQPANADRCGRNRSDQQSGVGYSFWCECGTAEAMLRINQVTLNDFNRA